jgi:serine/threonine-protein phosphatase 2B catalytic subunit
MSETYIRNAVAQIQERRTSLPAPQPGRAPGQGVGQDCSEVNTIERAVQNVPEPASFRPSDEQVFRNEPGRRVPDTAFLKQHFIREGRLREDQALEIVERATSVLGREPNLVQVKSPVTICGDIHGQYYDLMKLFEVGGSFEENNYLFLGDYVDRGNFGIECVLYLYALKIRNPSKLILLRGNHECRHLTEYFTFKRECLHKYSVRVYDACIHSFCALPIAAVVDDRFFCVHGGLSPELSRLSDLDKLNRFQEPGSYGLLCDLLWSDPIPTYGHEQEPRHGTPIPPGTGFLPNTQRGCSFTFTYEAASSFSSETGFSVSSADTKPKMQGIQCTAKRPQ